MPCNSEVRQGAVDGAIVGLCVGSLLGILDCIVNLIFSRNRENTNFTDRIIGGSIQGATLGLILGTAFSLAKYCLIFSTKILNMVCKGPCILHMKSGMVDGMLFGMLLGAIFGTVKVYRSDETDAQKAAVDIADWSVHVAVICALVGALIALARGF